MQKPLIIKLSIMLALCVIFIAGLTVVNNIADERKDYHQTVIDEIKQTQVANQQLMTPFIMVETTQDKQNLTKLITAIATDFDGNLSVTDGQYARGIHRAISFDGVLTAKQQYQLPTLKDAILTADIRTKTESDSLANPSVKLLIPVSDLRGTRLPTVRINNQEHTATFAKAPEQSHPLSRISLSYIQIDIDPAMLGTSLEIDISLPILGIDGVSMIALGEQHQFRLSSNWLEPKFYGDSLPSQKQLNATGFDAVWQNEFASQNNQTVLLERLACQAECISLSEFRLMNVDFVNTNNAYTHTDRAIKYALVLLLISFGTFFLFEVLKNLQIHPIQYSLVGCALLMFYVLLLSLAEQMAFWQAYAIAGVACVGLIGWYACHMLGSLTRGGGFAVILGGLYAVFYLILSLDDMNLLIGSVFCFVLLGVVMFLTRKVNWYKLQF